MDFINAIILGIVQGLTEFLPISSSGHLILAHDLLSFDFIDDVAFDVALHLGTLLALILFFWRDILRLIIAFFQSFAKWDFKNEFNQRLAWYLLIGSIPAALVGFFFEGAIESSLRSPWLVASMLVLGGILFLIFERIAKQSKRIEELRLSNVILIGVAQVLALIPGISRSGITIVAGLSQNLKREQAARFSFLLAIPIVFGAGVVKMVEVLSVGLRANQWLILVLGFLAAGIVGYMVIKFLLRFLQNHSLRIFAYYRFIIALIVLLIFALS